MDKVRRKIRNSVDEANFLIKKRTDDAARRVSETINRFQNSGDLIKFRARLNRQAEDLKHTTHKEKIRVKRRVNFITNGIRNAVCLPMEVQRQMCLYRYSHTPFSAKIRKMKDKMGPRPADDYHMHPVVFSMDLDERGREPSFRKLYDAIFKAFLSLTVEDVPTIDPKKPPYYIGMADLILLSHSTLKVGSVTITENFDVFVSRSTDCIILVAENISQMSDVVCRVFRSIYARTALKSVPLLCLLASPLAEASDAVWRERIGEMETMALREKLLHFDAINIPHRVCFVRSEFVENDLGRGLMWLWMRSGIRDRRKVVPLATLEGTNRKFLGLPNPRKGSTKYREYNGFSRGSRRQSVLVRGRDTSIGEKKNKHKKVKIDPIPTDIDHKPTAVRSMKELFVGHDAEGHVAVGSAKWQHHKGALTQTRSLDKTTLKKIDEAHPNLLEEMKHLRNTTIHLPSSTFATNPHHHHRISLRSTLEMRKLEDEEAAQRAREKFVEDKEKYLDLKRYKEKLEAEADILNLEIGSILQRLRIAKSPVLNDLPPIPQKESLEHVYNH
ncbi:hypothetical protein RvY_10819 [Ramazzottius varieornatus]|uniref:Uncharacterized protein n=1 Tax=Ramazzottius varieornatus TaxID=947166 RepID=A0A1D1VE15_RAMVA|nr:hypothetical protein RvY_10819 [Ramazzottius varieornatus]